MKIKDKLIAVYTTTEKISKYTIFILFGLFATILAVASIFSTTYFATNYYEIPLYEDDSPILLIGIFIVLIILLYLFDKWIGLDKINPRIYICVLMVYTVAVASLWLYYTNSATDADQKIVHNIAIEFYDGEFSALSKWHYLYIYPYQLGITAFIELSSTIFGRGSLLLLRIFNVLASCLTFYSLYRITDLSFHNRKINNLVILLMFGCFPPILYCTFVYGNIMGLGFSLVAVWMQMKYFNSGKIRYVVLSALSIAFAVLVRSNSLIVLVAMVIMYLLKFLNTRRAICLLWPVIAIAVTSSATVLLNTYYESRSGIEISDGAPKIIWFAMGMQESARAPGWYNGFSYSPYVNNNCDPIATTEVAKQAIKESLEKFKADPMYAAEFYTEKFVSQWNEPTYQGFWISRILQEGKERPEIVTSLYYGDLHYVAVDFMNIYQFIIVFGAVFFFALQRKLSSEQLFLALIVFGGFLFHMLWEAKAQYIMTYFTMIVPYGAVGIYNIIELLRKNHDRIKQKLLAKKTTPNSVDNETI